MNEVTSWETVSLGLGLVSLVSDPCVSLDVVKVMETGNTFLKRAC